MNVHKDITADRIMAGVESEMFGLDYFRALQVHDAETANDYNEQVNEINTQYKIMKQ